MDLIPSDGFSLTSMFRGILGMGILLLIAFLFSVNRRQIAWRTVGIGSFMSNYYCRRGIKNQISLNVFSSL